MSPIDRDRARDKRRYEKHQTKLDMRAVESRRNKQVLGIVLAMLLVIGGLVGVSLAANTDKISARGHPTPHNAWARERRAARSRSGTQRYCRTTGAAASA